MAAKKPALGKKNHSPKLEVRFVAPGLKPARVPLRTVADALSAVQDLASGRDPFESKQVPIEKAIGLVDVKAGSAVYVCESPAIDEARLHLTNAGQLIAVAEEGEAPDSDGLIALLRPIETLSQIAKQLDCSVEVSLVNGAKHSFFSVNRDDFKRISERLFLKGETTIVGEVKRVGGSRPE